MYIIIWLGNRDDYMMETGWPLDASPNKGRRLEFDTEGEAEIRALTRGYDPRGTQVSIVRGIPLGRLV